MTEKMHKPVLSKQAFWDVDMDNIDYEKNALYVMEQVLDWGTSEDFRSIVRFYGKERVSRELVNTKVLGDIEINFCCLIFKIKVTDFKYYEKRPSRSLQKFREDFKNYLNC